MRASLRDLQHLGEALVLIAVTWVLLGWYFDHPITTLDGAAFLAPYTQSQLAAGGDWTEHAYRFGVLGGAPMHAYAGTLPLVRVAAWLGLSTTATLDIGTLFLQLASAFFGLLGVESLRRIWGSATTGLPAPGRLVTYWLCAFAPWLGWRLTLGHENVVQGSLPLLVGCSVLVAARAGLLTSAGMLAAFVTVANAVSGYGGQLLFYCAVFGSPLALVVLLGTRPWNRSTLAALLAVAAGLLVAIPRVSAMLAFAGSDDASRSLDVSVTFELGAAHARDWLGSLAWTRAVTDAGLAHEVNYPVGPLLCFLVLLWPRGRGRAVAITLLATVAVIILYASHIGPVASLLHAALPPLNAFRVPARALIPLLALVPGLAIALYWIACDARTSPLPARATTLGWLAIALAAAVIALHGHIPATVAEIVAWATCVALAVLARTGRIALPIVVAAVAALGVLAFEERVPRVPADAIEHGPAQLHAAVVRQAPEVAMPLARVQVVDAPPPYRVGLGWAARLSSLDGDFNPPRRFLRLLSQLSGKDLPATTVIFSLARNRAFPLLQQLYNVRYGLVFGAGGPSLQAFPPTPGAAWAPRRIAIATAPPFAKETLGQIAWVEPEHALDASPVCEGHVSRVTVDARGQRATVELEARTACTIVVATNHVAMLQARLPDGRALPTFPVDVALTGVTVPAGTTSFTLGAEITVGALARLASVLGWLALAAALLVKMRDKRA